MERLLDLRNFKAVFVESRRKNAVTFTVTLK